MNQYDSADITNEDECPRQMTCGSSDDGDDDDGSSGDDSGDDAQEATDQHRAALGSLLQNLQSQGIDVNSLAQEAGLDSADVTNLEDDDLQTLSSYVAQAHPELTQQVFSRFPLAQSILGRFLG